MLNAVEYELATSIDKLSSFKLASVVIFLLIGWLSIVTYVFIKQNLDSSLFISFKLVNGSDAQLLELP